MNSSPEDFEEFCSSHYSQLLRMLTLHCGDSALAEEFAQEALVRAAQHWNKVRNMENPSGWLWRVAFNLTYTFFRRRVAENRVRRRLAAELTGRPDQADPSDHVAVLQMLRGVSPKQRTVLILRYLNDLTFEEIADVLDSPVSTVKSHAQRGLARMRTSVQVQTKREAIQDVR